MAYAICFTQEVAVTLKQWKPKQTKETAVVSAKWDRERSPDFRIEESISRHGCETRMRSRVTLHVAVLQIELLSVGQPEGCNTLHTTVFFGSIFAKYAYIMPRSSKVA